LPKEQIISTILGIVVVVIIGSIIYRYFQKGQEGIIDLEGEQKETLQENEIKEGLASLPAVYKVQKGDHLWKIAEKFYQSGYNWVDIAKANNLINPDLISVGQELKIPSTEAKLITVREASGEEKTISSSKHTVKEGDWLSKIALRAYGDMFAWEKIYEANKEVIGSNPHLIKPGQVLIIPE